MRKLGAPWRERSSLEGRTRVPSKWSVLRTRPLVRTLPCLDLTTLPSPAFLDQRGDFDAGRAAARFRDARMERSSDAGLAVASASGSLTLGGGDSAPLPGSSSISSRALINGEGMVRKKGAKRPRPSLGRTRLGGRAGARPPLLPLLSLQLSKTIIILVVVIF